MSGKRIFTSLAAMLLIFTCIAQSPAKLSYQAVIRNTDNQLVANQSIGMRISIIQGMDPGITVYEEIYNPNPVTNANGLISVEIGSGIPVSGSFATIEWSNGPYFIKTETDPSGGTSYTIEGTSQLLSVPYALYAADSESIWDENGSDISFSGGNVGIGNTSPDEELVVGDNLEGGWAFPAVTSGSSTGGVVQVGTPDIKFSASAGTTFERTRLIASDEGGFGNGAIEMRTRQLNVGLEPGLSENNYMLRVVHDSYGFSIENSETEDNWELLTSFVGGNLILYFNEANLGEFDATSGNYAASSDRSLKTNIEDVSAVLPKVMNLAPKEYNYKKDLSSKYIGLIAQDLQEEFPQVVRESQGREGEKGTLLVDYSQLTVLAIGAIQEQQQVIEDQDEKIADLEERLEDLESLIEK